MLCAALLMCLVATGKAQNYPYRSDALWITVPNHADWIYRTGEKATIEVQLLHYGVPQEDVTIHYEVADDLMKADRRDSVKLSKGRATIPVGTMRQPGFRDCRMWARIGSATYRHHIKLGFSPEQIVPYTQMPNDFQAFWQQSIKEASEFPLTYTLQPADDYSTDRIKCYLLKLTLNKQGQAMYGYLFYPREIPEGGCPVVLTPPGAGIKTIKTPLRHKYYAEQGCIRLEMEIHGLNPTLSDEHFSEISRAFNGKENGYLTVGLDQLDSYYMKRVYLGMVRCIDFLTSLPEWDGKHVATVGGSQGGALALVAAALHPKVTHCVANHPALTDMAGFKAKRADGYPHFSKIAGMDTPEKVKTMAYYDVINFARLLHIPTRLTWGFNDDTCSPTTSYAVYNILTCPKEALITPVNEHWTSEETERSHFTWLLEQFKL